MPTDIFIPKQELWDESREVLVTIKKDRELSLEHSLVSLSKWESKWRKPFLSPEAKTQDEIRDYFRCMIINEDKDIEDEIGYAFTNEDMIKVQNYIDTPQTATSFPEEKNSEPRSNELMTSELIYYYLGQMQCPFIPTENWHLSRVMTLIRIASFKNKPEKKLSYNDSVQQCEDINERNKRYFEEMRRKAEREGKL